MLSGKGCGRLRQLGGWLRSQPSFEEAYSSLVKPGRAENETGSSIVPKLRIARPPREDGQW